MTGGPLVWGLIAHGSKENFIIYHAFRHCTMNLKREAAMRGSTLVVSILAIAVILAGGADLASGDNRTRVQLNWVVGDGIESTVDATSPVGPVASIEVRGKSGTIEIAFIILTR